MPKSSNSLRPPFALIEIDRNAAVAGQGFTYGIPDRLHHRIAVGDAVHVPFGRKIVTGYVTGFTEELDFDRSKLRLISSIVSAAPIFDEQALRLAKWMSAYYHAPLNECLACFMPHGWQKASVKKYFYRNEGKAGARYSPQQTQIIELVQAHGKPITSAAIEKEIGSRNLTSTLRKLVDSGIIGESTEFSRATVKPKLVKAARLLQTSLSAADIEKLLKRAPRQQEAYANLQHKSTFEPVLLSELGGSLAIWRGLEEKKLIKISEVEIKRRPTSLAQGETDKPPLLMPQQRHAVDVITGALRQNAPVKKPPVILLHGVTASGKTEVYLAAIQKCLDSGKRALVLVPEIALTAQTVAVFQRRFGEKVAILHSALSGGERFDEWRRIRADEADIVIGARSAVFAPCHNLGLIIIDEEHDYSYKQENTPRYHARLVAQRRAAFEGAVLVLGTATPSMESYLAAKQGKFTLVEMPERIENRPLPKVEIVDMTDSIKGGEMPILGEQLKDELITVIRRKKQAILFLNRRGFATYIQCIGCGHVEKCPHCDVTLTFHRRVKQLRCHHCGYSCAVPQTCPECNGWMMSFAGTGTEKVEEEVHKLLSQHQLEQTRVLRLDRDTTSRKGSHARILRQFRRKEAQILIGTQMVTKGLDFPDVTLVGVISADTGLNMPDFRANERTFQLLSQVAGRAGRGGDPGKVLIQTITSDHYAIEAAQQHDYATFMHQELETRDFPPYPPYSFLTNIIISDKDVSKAKLHINEIALRLDSAIEKLGGGTDLLGPVECPIARVKDQFRFHILLRDRNRRRLHRVLAILDELPNKLAKGLVIDVDPMSII